MKLRLENELKEKEVEIQKLQEEIATHAVHQEHKATQTTTTGSDDDVEPASYRSSCLASFAERMEKRRERQDAKPPAAKFLRIEKTKLAAELGLDMSDPDQGPSSSWAGDFGFKVLTTSGASQRPEEVGSSSQVMAIK